MYKVKNNTNGKLLINDLGIKLSSGEEIDLDTKFSRDAIEASSHLRIAENRGFIAVLHKDVFTSQQSIDNLQTISDMEQHIRNAVISELSQRESKDSEIASLHSKIDSLLQIIASQSSNKPISKISDKEVYEEHTNDDKIIEVHQKALARISKEVTGNVEAKKDIVDSDVSERADELDEFLK